MPISGLVATCGKGEEGRVIPKLRELPGVEVHGSDGRGNLVLVAEAETSSQLESIVDGISRLDGVLTVSMTYLNFEDETDTEGSEGVS